MLRSSYRVNVQLCLFPNTGNELWLVMPYCEGGSVAHLMKYSHVTGLDEVLIASITKQVSCMHCHFHQAK